MKLYLQGSISKDSMLHKLYDMGKISKSTYLGDISTPNWAQAVREVYQKAYDKVLSLRTKAKYKFAYHALMQLLDSATLYDSIDYSDFEIRRGSEDPLALEEYELWSYYRLYRFPSFDNTSNHYVIGEYLPGFAGFFLIGSDTSRASIIDRLDISRQGHFDRDTLNGGNILRIEYRTTGTGYYADHLMFVALVRGRFQTLYNDYAEIFSSYPFSERPTTIKNTLRFVDLNRDGFLDILKTTKEDTFKDISDPHDGIKPIQSKTTTERYFWSPILLRFVEDTSKKL